MLIRGNNGADAVMLDGVTSDWPLIRFLLDDSIYRATYRERLAEMLAGPFEKTAVKSRIAFYRELIAPFVIGDEVVEGGESESSPYTQITGTASFSQGYDDSANGLIAHIDARHIAVENALALSCAASGRASPPLAGLLVFAALSSARRRRRRH